MPRQLTAAVASIVVSCVAGCQTSGPPADSHESDFLAWSYAPRHVNLDDEFVFEVHVKNQSDQEIVLESVDVGESFLERVSVLHTTPGFFTTTPVGDGTTAFWFRFVISPGDYEIVEFKARAEQPGVAQGDLDICVDSVNDCELQVITVPVFVAP